MPSTPTTTIDSAPYSVELQGGQRFDYSYVKTHSGKCVLVTLGGLQKCYYAIPTSTGIIVHFTGSKGCSEIKKVHFYVSDCSTPTPAATTTPNPTTLEPTTLTPSPTPTETTPEPTTTATPSETPTTTVALLSCCGTVDAKGPCWQSSPPLQLHLATQVQQDPAADPGACCHACELNPDCAQWVWTGECRFHYSSVCANPIIPYGILATDGGTARC